MMKLVLLILLFSSNGFAQNLVGYTFFKGNKQTPFQLALAPFTTDGCTRYKEGPSIDPSKWEHCCIAHDLDYWLGGTKEERKQSDLRLKACVAETGHTAQAKFMYAGTRAGGGPLRHTTYRWGYGWNRIRDYHELTPQEKETAFSMYGEDLVNLKKDISEKKFTVVVPESYAYVSPFEYTFCEEQIIEHLTPILAKSATVTKAKTFQIGSDYYMGINLDICEDRIEFAFNRGTDQSSCKKDYAATKQFNKIVDVKISKECLSRIKEP